jgi:hypothetical protein
MRLQTTGPAGHAEDEQTRDGCYHFVELSSFPFHRFDQAVQTGKKMATVRSSANFHASIFV